MKLVDLLPDFMIDLEEQLISYEKQHGDSWKEKPRAGQEDKIYEIFHKYMWAYKTKGNPIP